MTPIAAASRGKRYKLRIARVGCENVILLQNHRVSGGDPFVHPGSELVVANRRFAGRRLLPSRSPLEACADIRLGLSLAMWQPTLVQPTLSSAGADAMAHGRTQGFFASLRSWGSALRQRSQLGVVEDPISVQA